MDSRRSGSFSSIATYSYYSTIIDNRRDSFLSTYELEENIVENDCRFKYIELEIKADNLKIDHSQNLSLLCEVEELDDRIFNNGVDELKWKTIGRTEELHVSSKWNSPVWTNRVRISYLPKKIQQLRFCLVYIRSGETRSNYVWNCYSILSDLVSGSEKHFPLFRTQRKRADGTESGELLIVKVHTEENSPKLKLRMSLSAENLRSTRRFASQPSAYYRLSYKTPSVLGFYHLFESEVIKQSMNPKWKPIRIKIPSSNAGMDQITLNIAVFEKYERNGKKSSLIGETTIPIKGLLKSKKLRLNRKSHRYHLGTHQNLNFGTLIVEQALVKEMPSFKKIIHDGMKLDFVIAVDFSYDDRAMIQHHILPDEKPSEDFNFDQKRESNFSTAIKAVGSVIDNYATSQSVQALGFGAKMKDIAETQYYFSLNGKENAQVDGSSGLIDAYNQSLEYVRLSGPSRFTPLLTNVSKKCNESGIVSQKNQHFTILIIMSHGNIGDFEETVETIIDISHTTPICIVIVGVGRMDFSKMEELDSDDALLRIGTRIAKYDIVQFLEYTKGMSTEELEAGIFDEVSTLLVDYMTDHDAVSGNIVETPTSIGQSSTSVRSSFST